MSRKKLSISIGSSCKTSLSSHPSILLVLTNPTSRESSISSRPQSVIRSQLVDRSNLPCNPLPVEPEVVGIRLEKSIFVVKG